MGHQRAGQGVLENAQNSSYQSQFGKSASNCHEVTDSTPFHAEFGIELFPIRKFSLKTLPWDSQNRLCLVDILHFGSGRS